MFYILYERIIPNTAPGNRFVSLLKGFDKLGVDGVAVLLQPSGNHYRIPNDFGSIRIKYFWRDWPFITHLFDKIYGFFAYKRFKAKLKRGDIVFCFGSSKYVADLVQIRGIRVFHERTESPEVLPLCNSKKQKQYLKACNKLSGIFVISTALKTFFVNNGMPIEKICIVNMTVDIQRFASLKKSTTTEKYIAYCGTVSNNKDGVDDLIKAFALVCQKYKDVKLYIIGASPSVNDESGNLKLINDLGITDKVVLTGVIEASKMPQLLLDSTILALDRPDSLQAKNGFPTKLGEYLMTGNPVVVTKVGDIPLFLKDGVSALLAEQRNTKEFASKICWVLDHPTESEAIGNKGKEVAMKEFNYQTESKKIIDMIYGKDTYCG
jgi:glycosyltransferase involved in cell wall biosynthesis